MEPINDAPEVVTPPPDAESHWEERTLWQSRRHKLIWAALRRANGGETTARRRFNWGAIPPSIRMSLYVLGVVSSAALMILLPPPLSTGVLLVVLAVAAVIAWHEFDLRRLLPYLRLPGFIAAHRNKLAFVSAAAAFALMIGAALDFHVDNRLTLLNDGALKLVIGGLLLGVAVGLSTRQPALPGVTSERLSPARRGWWIPTLMGGGLLLILGEISSPRLSLDALRSVDTDVQVAIFGAGLALLAWGMGGVPGFRRPRVEWQTTLPLILILIGAFLVRALGSGDTLRSSMDELHFTDGIMRVYWTPDLRLLTPMSAQSPFTWVFTYFQSLTAKTFGYDFGGMRIASAFIGTITVWLTYHIAREVLDSRKTALLCALFVAAFAPHVHFSRSGIIQIADPMVGAMAILFAARGLRTNRRLDWALAGVGLGLSQYFYEGGRLLFPALMVVWLAALIVLRRDHLRRQWAGIGVMLVTTLLIATPYYYVLTGSSSTLFGRMDESGLGDQYWEDLFKDGLSISDTLRVGERFLTPFRVMVAHRDLSAYYGGDQALVVDYLIPFFLFGALYLFWRMPAAALVIPLWILGTGLGNGLLRDSLVSSRYVIVLPALAVAIAAGMRYLLPFVWTRRADTLPESERPSEHWLRFAVPLVVVGFFSAAQLHYYFYPHLARFNVQIRDFKPYRDGIDVALRAAELPMNTQTIIVGRPEHDTVVPRNLLGYLTNDETTDPPSLLSYRTDQINPRFLLNLRPELNYAFFVEADDFDTINLLIAYLPEIQPPRFSLTADLPARKEYVLLFYPANPSPPRAPAS